jgi:hypothetical protein
LKWLAPLIILALLVGGGFWFCGNLRRLRTQPLTQILIFQSLAQMLGSSE